MSLLISTIAYVTRCRADHPATCFASAAYSLMRARNGIAIAVIKITPEKWTSWS